MGTFANATLSKISKKQSNHLKLVEIPKVKKSNFEFEGVRLFPIVLDMDTVESVSSDIKFKQYDYGTSFIDVQLVETDSPIDLSHKTTVGVFTDSDGEVFVDEEGNPVSSYAKRLLSLDGVIKLPIPQKVLKTIGIIECEIMVFDKELNRTTTPKFSFYIEKSIFNHENFTPPSPSQSAICGEVLCGEVLCGEGVESVIFINADSTDSSLSNEFTKRFGKE